MFVLLVHFLLKAVIEETRASLAGSRTKYHGWPTIARRANGELLIAYSAREEHACPFGRVELMRSKDGGRSWSWPQVIHDGPIDDRDSGVIETAKGSLLVTTITNSQWEKKLDEAKPGEEEKRYAAMEGCARSPYCRAKKIRAQAVLFFVPLMAE